MIKIDTYGENKDLLIEVEGNIKDILLETTNSVNGICEILSAQTNFSKIKYIKFLAEAIAESENIIPADFFEKIEKTFIKKEENANE